MERRERYLSNSYKFLIMILAAISTNLILNLVLSNTLFNIIIIISVVLVMYYFLYYSKYKDNFKNKYYFDFFKESYLAAAILNVGILLMGTNYNKDNGLLLMGLIFAVTGIVGHKFFKN